MSIENRPTGTSVMRTHQDLQLLILCETLEAIVGFSNVSTIDSKDHPSGRSGPAIGCSRSIFPKDVQ